MIQTLKSELKLRPTYDEMIGMIEEQDKENRPPIEKVIDRRATLFRNNQFGSQFDNLDFLGLKKQEEDRARNNLRQAQLRKAGIEAGTSTGVMDLRARGFETPSEVNMDDEEDNIMLSEDIARIRAEMERSLQRQQQAQQATSSTARSDLEEVHRQSLPTGVDLSQPASSSQPATIPAQQPADSSEEELIPADDTSGGTRPFQRAIQYWNNDIDEIRQNQNVTYEDLMFQLHARGQLSEAIQQRVEEMPDDDTRKIYLLRIIERLIGSGGEDNEWQVAVNQELFKKRLKDWQEMRKPKQGVVKSFLASAGSAVVEAGKEAVKDALIAGAQNAVMSLL